MGSGDGGGEGGIGFAPGRSVGMGNAKSGGIGMSWNRPLTVGGWGSAPANFLGPSTRVSLHTTFFMPSSGLTQGPAVSLHPPDAAIDISRPSRSASAAAWRNASFQSGVIQTSRLSTNSGTPRLPSNICMPAMPTRFIPSRSAVMPSLVTLPFSQCHHTRGRADSGGSLKPRSSASSCGAAPRVRGGAAEDGVCPGAEAARARRATLATTRVTCYFPEA